LAEVLTWLDAQDVSMLRDEARREWQQFVERLRHDERFEGRSLLAPFFAAQQTQASLLDYLPATAPLLVSEPVLVAQMASEYSYQHEQRRLQHVQNGELPPWYPTVVLPWRELLTRDGVAPIIHLAHADLAFGELLAAAEIHPLPTELFRGVDLYGGRLKELVVDIGQRLASAQHVYVVTPQAARLYEMVVEAGSDVSNLHVVHAVIDAGWSSPLLGLTVYSDAEDFWLDATSYSRQTQTCRA
jgi:hypothetical protein